MRSRLHQVLAVCLAFAVATWPSTARASIFGEENAALTTLVSQGVAEIAQMGEAINTAQQTLQMARDVYAGVGEFVNFNPDDFLNGQKSQWSSVPLLGELQGLVTDVANNGLNGGNFDARRIAGQFDVYRDMARRQAAKRSMNGTMEPYDAQTALTLSRETSAVLNNGNARQRLSGQPDGETISAGLFAADASRVDPQLLDLYMQRRATAKEAEYQAYKLFAEASGASPGKAQQLAALAAGMSAQELARIEDRLTESTTLQQLEYQQKAAAQANQRQETDFLWNDLEGATKKAFTPAQSNPEDVDWSQL